jgi:hypothetical protein
MILVINSVNAIKNQNHRITNISRCFYAKGNHAKLLKYAFYSAHLCECVAVAKKKLPKYNITMEKYNIVSLAIKNIYGSPNLKNVRNVRE